MRMHGVDKDLIPPQVLRTPASLPVKYEKCHGECRLQQKMYLNAYCSAAAAAATIIIVVIITSLLVFGSDKVQSHLVLFSPTRPMWFSCALSLFCHHDLHHSIIGHRPSVKLRQVRRPHFTSVLVMRPERFQTCCSE